VFPADDELQLTITDKNGQEHSVFINGNVEKLKEYGVIYQFPPNSTVGQL
jgi:hypothetical protein